MERKAICQCGALCARVTGDPRISYVCHCRACQRRTGAVLHAGGYYFKSQVSYQGVSRVYTRRADSGFDIRFHFCRECGTSVYWETDKYPDQCGIASGCFADPDFPPPSLSMWEQSRHPWLELPASLQRLERGIAADGTPMR
jgi:hypothetical protein